jgi:hypothetical protein
MYFESSQRVGPAAAGGNNGGIAGKLAAVILAAGVVWSAGVQAATIVVPNGSFESPATTNVDLRIDAWEKTPKPFWWDEATYGAWDNLVGAFTNVPPGDPRYIDNCEGGQAIWIFSNPEAGLFQDYDSIDWAHSTPTHAFNTRYEPGKSYQLTVGLLVGIAFPMAEGATLQLSLYYRDAASNRVTVAATIVTNTATAFSNGTHLVDFQVNVPPVKSSDEWAGKHIGIQLLSTVRPDLAGGYWDVDNVRLSEFREPTLASPVHTNGQFRFTLLSEPGVEFEMMAATNVTLAASNWTSLGTVTNDTGTFPFVDATTNLGARFYRARQVP